MKEHSIDEQRALIKNKFEVYLGKVPELKREYEKFFKFERVVCYVDNQEKLLFPRQMVPTEKLMKLINEKAKTKPITRECNRQLEKCNQMANALGCQPFFLEMMDSGSEFKFIPNYYASAIKTTEENYTKRIKILGTNELNFPMEQFKVKTLFISNNGEELFSKLDEEIRLWILKECENNRVLLRMIEIEVKRTQLRVTKWIKEEEIIEKLIELENANQ